jgi:hypothetical protein
MSRQQLSPCLPTIPPIGFRPWERWLLVSIILCCTGWTLTKSKLRREVHLAGDSNGAAPFDC